MFVKITNGNVDTYPYSVRQLRRDNPNTSFPKKVSDAILEGYGVYPVSLASVPSFVERTQKLNQNTQPHLEDGQWVLGWTITDKTAEEIQEYDDNEAASVRSRRDGLLTNSDWTQVADAPVNAQSWATYRQALRDITDHENFPYLQEEDWPTKPQV